MADLPVVGGYLDGAKLTLGYLEHDASTVDGADEAMDATAALNWDLVNFH